MPIGNAILLKALQVYVPRNAPGITGDAVAFAGPLNLQSLTSSGALLNGLRQAWALSIGRVNLLLTIVICISVPTAFGMKWLNIKKISREREERKQLDSKSSRADESSELPREKRDGADPL